MKKELSRFEKYDRNFGTRITLLIICVIASMGAYMIWGSKVETRKPLVETPTSGSGYIIRYLDKQVAMVSIRVPKDAPEKEFNEWLVTAKAAIEKADVRHPKKIVHTVPLKPIDNSAEKGITIKKFVIIVQPIEPNTPF